MEDCQLSFTMRVTLLATLVAHWGPLGLSSAQDGSHVCCTELEMLAKKFPDEAYDEFTEDCTTWLLDMRASMSAHQTNCSIPEHAVCEKYGVEKRTTGMTMRNRDWQRSVHVTVRNILRVVDTQNWRNCGIVYDFTFGRTSQLLMSSLSERRMYLVTYHAVQLNDTSELRNMLREVFTDFNIRNIIVLSADVTFCALLFKEAEEYDRKLGRTSGLRMFTRWVVTTSAGLEPEIAEVASYFDNVAAVIESQEIIVTNDTSSAGLMENRIECVRTEMASLMYTDKNSSREFQSSSVLLSTGDIIVDDAFPNMRHGFNTRTLAVGTKAWPPFVVREEDETGTPVFKGMCMDLLNELARELNFTYVFVEPPYSEGWGTENASGHWGGLVGQLQREEVDLVVAPLSFSSERTLVMDATYPFAVSHVAVVFKKPDPDAEKWKTYLRPFRGEVLVCLGATLIVVTSLVHVLAWLHPSRSRTDAEEEEERRNGKGQSDKQAQVTKKKDVPFPGPSPDDGFWYLYGALFSQGGVLLPKTASGRMLIASWWLFSIVIGATYSGNLIAFLTVVLETKPFSTIQEMLDQDDYIWGVADKTSTYRLIMDSKNPLLQAVGRRMMEFAATDPDVLNMDLEVQMSKVMAGGYAHFAESVTTEAYTREYCDLDHVINYDSMTIPYSVSLPKGSSYTRLFDEYVMRIVEAGLMTKWQRDWFTDSLKCATNSISGSPKITVLDVQSALYILIIGLVLALISLALECLCHRHPKLCFWTRNVGNACVNGCEEEESSGVPPGHGTQKPDRGGTQENEFLRVCVVDGGSGEEKFSSGFFDFSSVHQRNRSVFDTVYSTPEDFGRVPVEDYGKVNNEDLYFRASWERRGSRMVCITDDIKVTT